jgi:hypothetical protein
VSSGGSSRRVSAGYHACCSDEEGSPSRIARRRAAMSEAGVYEAVPSCLVTSMAIGSDGAGLG